MPKAKEVKRSPFERAIVPGLKPIRTMGIDPGIHGGIALIGGETLLHVAPMPIRFERKSDGEYRTLIDGWALAEFMVAWAPDVIYAEDVYSMQDQGVVSVFSFGMGKGVIDGCAAAGGHLLRWVSPQRWKAQMGVMPPREPGTTDKLHKERLKALSIARAQTLYPDAAPRLTKDGPAEAALIGAYGAIVVRREAAASRVRPPVIK